MLNQGYAIQHLADELKQKVTSLGHDRQIERRVVKDGETFTDILQFPSSVNSPGDLDDLIEQLRMLKSKISIYEHIKVTIELKD